MTEYNRDVPARSNAARTWGELNAELLGLEGKTDPASCERPADLLDQLMCADMALGPMRKAMAKGGEPTGNDDAVG